MCKYCKGVMTGDDYKDLFEIPFTIHIANVKSNIGYFSAGLVVEKDKPVIEASVYLGEPTNFPGKHFPVKYCPMCGEDLNRLIELSDRRRK